MAELQELLDKVKTYDWGQSRETLTDVANTPKKASGNEAEMAKIEKTLLSCLESPDATRAGRDFVCRQLSIIGTVQSVPILSKMLTNEEYSDMARYALERIPGSAIDAALLEALPKATGKPKIGIINSVGQRRCSQATEALGKLLSDSDETVAVAAAAALGRIANAQATKILAEAKSKTSGKLQMRVMDAYLLCADRLAAEGKKDEALAIYKELQQNKLPKPIRGAATRGLISAMKK
jgi:HEAT repeat protein